jgi:hypothetical protein
MRLAIHRYSALLVGWIPDVSQIPPRRLVLIGVGVSVLLHMVAFILLVLLSGIIPKADLDTPAPPREIELTIVPPDEPPPEPLLPLAPNPQRQFLDPTGLDISKVAPEKPDFESSENGIAASEQPGKGDIPLPNQDGRDMPFMAFRTQRALFGASSKPFPADPETTSLKTPPPEANPTPSASDVALKPAPEPEKVAKESAPATPAPAATPPPYSIEKTETPAVAQATPPPLKVVDKTKEDEIAVSTKPPATPPPSTAQTDKPQPPAPTPVPPVALPTPRPVVRQVMLVTPAPRFQPPVQPPPRPSTQMEQEQNHIEGSISNRGKRAANTVATPLGKYRKQVIDAIGSRWQYYVKSHADVLALGSARVSFLVDSSGHVRAVRVENNTSNQSFADLCERAIREAEIPEPPADAVAPMRDGHLEYSINFTLYSL